jgi:hypothetical protein
MYFRGAVLALNGGEEPPLRDAAKTLAAISGQHTVENQKKIIQKKVVFLRKIRNEKTKKI